MGEHDPVDRSRLEPPETRMKVEMDNSVSQHAEMIRLGFRLPTVLLYLVKRRALDDHTTMSLLTQRWIDTGLAGGFGNPFKIEVPTDGRMTECRIQLPAETREAVRARASQLDLSGAHLMRLWMAQGVHDEGTGALSAG